MSAKRLITRGAAALLLLLAALPLVSCQKGERDQGEPATDLIFGNGFADTSPVIAKVGDLEITRNMLDLRYEELPPSLKARFSGEGWEKRFLRFMVDEALLVKGAVARKLYLKPEVAQNLITQRRITLKSAMENQELVAGLEPTEEQVRLHYRQNKDSYMRQGLMRARHVECDTRELARKAYDKLREGGKEGHWGWVAGQFSENAESAKQAGDLGWFNRGGFIPALPYGREFSEAIWDWEKGLHEPVMIGGDWHVIEVLEREYERPMSLQEARDRIVNELKPILEEEAREEFLRRAMADTQVEYFGAYRPGNGRNPKELFEMAWYGKTPEVQIDLYKMIVEDFSESDLADDALFMLANVYLDTWHDIPFASRYLRRLVEKYPQSELVADAQYMIENMGKPEFLKPKGIEDLKAR